MNFVWVGDLVVESGFGRIGNEVCRRLAARGHQIIGVGLQYNGLYPHQLPFHVVPVQPNADLWSIVTETVNGIRFFPNNTRPDAVIVCQDFPYSLATFRDCRIDWSGGIKQLIITPIDGEPIFDEWVELAKFIDGNIMTISEFGVEALRKRGVHAYLCPPGVDGNKFRKPSEAERAMVRGKAGIDLDCFIVGMAAMNQGRKNIPGLMEAFKELALDKPKARLLLDMDKVSPAGWKLTQMGPNDSRGLQQEIGLRPEQVIYRDDLVAKGITEYAERLWLMDAHGVLSYREGFGLPLIEGMACGLPTFALDYCSGREIVGEGRGLLIQSSGVPRFGTWGEAMDYDASIPDLVSKLNKIYWDKAYRAYIAEQGRLWAIQRSWDRAADATETVLKAMLGSPNGYATEVIALEKAVPS